MIELQLTTPRGRTVLITESGEAHLIAAPDPAVATHIIDEHLLGAATDYLTRLRRHLNTGHWSHRRRSRQGVAECRGGGSGTDTVAA